MRGNSKKRKARTAEQDKWVQAVATMGCIECGSGAQVHHCVGETALHNKIPIGQEWILPLCAMHHRVVHAMGHDRKEYEKKKFEWVLLRATMESLQAPSIEIQSAIEDYHR